MRHLRTAVTFAKRRVEFRSVADCGCDTYAPADEELPAPPDPDAGEAAGWTGVLAVEGEPTGDGRVIEPNALRWGDLPIPLRWAKEDEGGHFGAVVVGRINSISRNGLRIEAEGDFDLGSEEGREAARQVSEGLTTGVSVDLDDVDMEVRVAGDLLSNDVIEEGFEVPTASEADADGRVTVMEVSSDDEMLVTKDARVRAATMVATPAFVEARIALSDGFRKKKKEKRKKDDEDKPGYAAYQTLEELLEDAPGGGLPDAYRPAEADDVPAGRACANCVLFVEGEQDDAGNVWCAWWEDWVQGEFYCDAWQGDADVDEEQGEEAALVASLSPEERTPTTGMAEEAQRALDWRADGNAGGEENTVQRARSIAAREPLGADTIRRMNAFFSRNARYPNQSGFSPGDDGYPSAARVAWGLWGGNAGRSWSSRLVERINREDALAASAYQVRTGSFVEWSWQDGTAQGQVERIVRDGQLEVPGTDTVINGDEDNPAVLIESWRRVELEAGVFFEPTGSMVGRRMDALTPIEPLRERPDGASVRASAIGDKPPAEWFADPGLSEQTPFTVTDDGRVFGHLATWGTCHTGFPQECVTAPTSASRYAYFRTGAVLTADGTEVPTGRVTMDTLHAGRRLGAADTSAHYEHTGIAVADVAAGEDEHGIWIAGALRKGVTEEQVEVLRASPLSGDWRSIGGRLELVAALAVNSPGFPIPRALVASGRVRALQGLPGPTPATIPSTEGFGLSEDDLRALEKVARRERTAEAARRADVEKARRRVLVAAAEAKVRGR